MNQSPVCHEQGLAERTVTLHKAVVPLRWLVTCPADGSWTLHAEENGNITLSEEPAQPSGGCQTVAGCGGWLTLAFASVGRGRVKQSFLLLSWSIEYELINRKEDVPFAIQILPRLSEGSTVPLASMALVCLGQVPPPPLRLQSPCRNPGLWPQASATILFHLWLVHPGRTNARHLEFYSSQLPGLPRYHRRLR